MKNGFGGRKSPFIRVQICICFLSKLFGGREINQKVEMKFWPVQLYRTSYLLTSIDTSINVLFNFEAFSGISKIAVS